MDGLPLLWKSLPPSWRPDPEERAQIFISRLGGLIVSESCVFWKTRYTLQKERKEDGGGGGGEEEQEQERNRFSINSKTRIPVNKISFAWFNGRVPIGRIINICGNKKCINPHHMADNSGKSPNTIIGNDFFESGVGDDNDQHLKKKRRRRMSENEVLDILQKHSVNSTAVGKSTISRIRKGNIYKSVIDKWKQTTTG